MAAPKRFPLQWPKSRPKTKQRKSSPFRPPVWTKMLSALEGEVKKLGGKGYVLSTNLPLNGDGRPYAQEGAIDNPGALVYFELEGMPVVFACDRWLTVGENVRAIFLSVEATRGIERWGASSRVEAFGGYSPSTALALNEKAGAGWRATLGIARHAKVTRDEIQDAYRELVKDAHPDRGGSPEAMARLNEARDRALEEVKA